MELGLLMIRVVLAGTFVVAGLAKLADLPGSRQAMRDFGVPHGLDALGGAALPLVELGVAMLLLPATTAWWGALAAVGLLGAFVAAIAVNMARGRTPKCHCFGQLHSAPIGWPTLLRNGALAALGLVVLWYGPQEVGPSAVGWLASLSGWGYVALAAGAGVAVVVSGQSWLMWNLLRQNGRLLLRVEALEQHLGLMPVADTVAPSEMSPGLPVGTLAPRISLPDLAGRQVTLADLLARRKPVLLIFVSPGCGACMDLLPDVAAWQSTHADRLTIGIVNRGDANTIRAQAAELGLGDVLMQMDNEVGEVYGVRGTPSAVLIGENGAIRSPLAPGANAVRTLVDQAANLALGQMLLGERRAPIALNDQAGDGNGPGHRGDGASSGPAVGMALPELSLPDVSGDLVASTSWRGRETVLLFWNPGCGFCQRMVEELRDWELAQGNSNNAPRLVLIATGGAEANRALALQSTVLLDDDFTVGRSLGVRGTPSALRIDAQGCIASRILVGASDVMALLRPQSPTSPTVIAQPVTA